MDKTVIPAAVSRNPSFLLWIPAFAGMTLLSSSMVLAQPAKVLLSTTTLLPGETLRIEVDGLLPSARIKALFMGKSYPFFVIGPNANRALIGIKLDAKPGTYGLTFKALPYTQLPADALPAEPFMIEVTTKVFIIENVNFAPEKTAL